MISRLAPRQATATLSTAARPVVATARGVARPTVASARSVAYARPVTAPVRPAVRPAAARPVTQQSVSRQFSSSTAKMSLAAARPAIFVCDIQEKFRKAIYEFDKVVATSQKVLRAAQILGIPVFVTTQNKARLGDTVGELKELIGDGKARLVVDADKTKFSMWTDELRGAFDKEFPGSAAAGSASASSATAGAVTSSASVVIVGIESHICVTQTALDLLAAGHRVYILADGVSSCNSQEIPIALARLRHAGATVTTSESWLYETMGDAGTCPGFKQIVGLVKDTSADTKAALAALVSKI